MPIRGGFAGNDVVEVAHGKAFDLHPPAPRVGEPFDPTMHEAIFQMPTADVTVDTVGEVVETGYFLGSTLLRVAKVVVQVPSDG